VRSALSTFVTISINLLDIRMPSYGRWLVMQAAMGKVQAIRAAGLRCSLTYMRAVKHGVQYCSMHTAA
jgi:hypothetical protein